MTIEVYVDGYGKSRKVGILRRHSGSGRERITYEHDADWLKSPEAFQFDPTLPLRRGTLHPGANRVMFGTLGDSAPDTWGRSLMRRRERRAAELEGRHAHSRKRITFSESPTTLDQVPFVFLWVAFFNHRGPMVYRLQLR